MISSFSKQHKKDREGERRKEGKGKGEEKRVSEEDHLIRLDYN